MKAAVIEKQGGIENIVYRDFPDPVVGPATCWSAARPVGLNYFDIFRAARHARSSGADAVDFRRRCRRRDRGGWLRGQGLEGRRPLPDRSADERRHDGRGGPGRVRRVLPHSAGLRDSAGSAPVVRRGATIPANYGTIYRMLFTNGDMQPDDLVLVLGASGGVGTATVQVVKAYGGRVIACAGTDEKCAKLKAARRRPRHQLQHAAIFRARPGE